MNNAYYQLYLRDVLAFARSLVIKCQGSAETLNRELLAVGHTADPDRPDTWKYYTHLAGEYHPTDTPMWVRSMDTLETIAFTRENLAVHRATAREYQYGSRYYHDLVRNYPQQIPLIHGILAPVDKARAIAAADGEVLYHNPLGLEENETNLVHQLQVWVYGFFNRWYNPQYMITDDLYLPSFLGILYAQLPSIVMLLRLRNAKTPFAHSFHVREYLASNGRLDEFIPYLTKRQQLFLYRNIRYINRHVGRQEIFERLVANLLTPRGLPLAGYRLAHDNAPLPEALYPEVQLTKHPINFGFNQSGVDTTSVHTILDKQRAIARDNPAVQHETELDIIDRTRSDRFSTLPTKVLESEVVDRSNSSIRSLEQVLLNEWLYLATHERYRAFINVPNPGSGELMTMSVKDAFIVAYYAFARARDLEVNDIPRVIAYEVLRDPLPTYHELQQIIDRRYVPIGMVQAIMDRVTPLGEYISTEGFYNACARLHDESLRLWELYSFQEHYLTRGLCEQLVKRHYMHIKCELVDTPTSFHQWLVDKGYGIADLSPLDLDQLYSDIVKAATGANLVTRRSLGEIQRAMLRLMGELSSYSVQYLRTINLDDFTYIADPAIRVGDVNSSWDAHHRLQISRVTALTHRSRTTSAFDVGDPQDQPATHWQAATRTRMGVSPNVGTQWTEGPIAHVTLNVVDVGIRSFSFTVDNPEPEDNTLSEYQYPPDGSDWPDPH